MWTFQDAQARGFLGRIRVVRVQHHLVLRVLEPTERAAFAVVWIGEQAQGIVRMRGQDHRVEPLPIAGSGADGHAEGIAQHLLHRAAGPHGTDGQGRDEPLHVRLRPAPHDAPLGRVAESDQPVVVEEVQQVVDRELVDPVGGRGPHGGRDRHEEVLPEAASVGTLAQPLAEGGAGCAPGRR